MGRPPKANYGEAWTELRDYLAEAVEDGRPLTGRDLAYMDELRTQALAPVTEWLADQLQNRD